MGRSRKRGKTRGTTRTRKVLRSTLSIAQDLTRDLRSQKVTATVTRSKPRRVTNQNIRRDINRTIEKRRQAPERTRREADKTFRISGNQEPTICSQRTARREIMHATNRAGRGSQAKPKPRLDSTICKKRK